MALADLRLKLGLTAPGIVSAHWLEPIDGIGMSVIAFEEGTRRGGCRPSIPDCQASRR
ncbi:MAG TPA: hypothetical protein VIY52_03450 [Streptosporangiaceae bacterium]